jgi:glycosyltransferase involved in cell wall biosynthesis
MPRFAGMIIHGMAERGHQVELWTSRQILGRLPMATSFVRKWLGYADQFLIFPRELRHKINQQPDDTLFVVTDQALGMWIPPLAHRPHVIHCHDFHALKSALGEFPENQVRRTGRRYQQLIRRGFSRGRAFICISEKSRSDLHRFLPGVPNISEVVHNGLNHPFRPMELAERIPLLKKTGVGISGPGFIVHVGGNQWYKNRTGVLKVYRALAAVHPHPPALWLIGAKPTEAMRELASSIPAPGEVRFLSGLTNDQVNAAYAHARVLLFPSLEEGFGWPIIEAMASGCPVITTNLAPMTEVAGDAARLIPRMPPDAAGQASWVKSAVAVLEEVVNLDPISRAGLQAKGGLNAARFKTEIALAAYEQIYHRVLGQDGK